MAGMVGLRDYFAAAALTGYMANETTWEPIESNKEDIDSVAKVLALVSYRIADAMLEARKR
jgi:hypothetical protein